MKSEDNELIKEIKLNYPKNAEKIIDAYHFASSAHLGVLRKSGEPYIIHPVAVAKILIENKVDYYTVIAGFLHDVVEDTAYTLDDIKTRYGEVVAKLVDGVTKIEGKALTEDIKVEDISAQKLLLSMGTDIRVILIKLADRLHNMRTISYLPREKQIKKANETNELFIPIAERLGIRKIRSELEELTFKTLMPNEYEKIKAEYDRRLKNRSGEIKDVEKKIMKALRENKIEFQFKGWPEHYYSLYKKITWEGIGRVYGMMLYKLIVSDELECYKVLGILHRQFRHLPNQIKDFISSPKPNGYRSLHTVLISDDGNLTFKVMIRTAEMDKVCEMGVASLWNSRDVDEGFNKNIEKYNDLKNITARENRDLSPKAFVSAIKSDLFSNVTWVFTPKLKPICLNSDKPTAIDFAYAVHTDIGHRAVSATVNGKKAPLTQTLKPGDIIEILVSEKEKSPSRSWLGVAKTTNARQKMAKYFSDHFTDHNTKRGKKMLEDELKKHDHTLGDLENFYPQISAEYNFSSLSELYANVGFESVTTMQIVSYVLEADADKNFLENIPLKLDREVFYTNISYPKCCTAIPGDKIVAVVGKNSIAVHRAECPQVKHIASEAIIGAIWKEKITQKFSCNIKIIAEDIIGFGANLLSLLSREKINLNKTQARKPNETECEFDLGLEVSGTEQLEKIIAKLEKLEGVKQIVRSFE